MKAANAWLALIVAAHVGLGVLYERATPIFEAPDEGFHFAVARWISLGRGLPVQAAGQKADWEQEGSQPPLYYLLAAGLIAQVDTRDYRAALVRNPFVRHEPGTQHNVNQYRHGLEQPPLEGTALAVRLVRWLSLALSGLTIWLTYHLARLAYPREPGLGLLAAALVAFNPMVLFINASMNNDNLLMLLSTATLLVTVHLMQLARAPRPAELAGLGLLLGLAALTKISGLVLWPVAALGLGWQAFKMPDGNHAEPHTALPAPREVWPLVRRLLPALVLVFGLAVLVAGWWYWRNQQLYGEWLGLDTMVAVAGPRTGPISVFEWLRDEGYGFFLSFWAVFGVFTVLPASWVHAFYSLLTLAAVVGGVWWALKRPVRFNPPAALLGLFCVLTLIGVVRWTLQTPATQGRLLFGAIAPLAIFLGRGLLAGARPLFRLRAGRHWANGFVLTLVAALVLVAAVIPDGYIRPRYAPPASLTEADLPEGMQRVGAVFGGMVELVGYTVAGEPIRPGQGLPVTLYWRVRQRPGEDFALALNVLGRQGAQVGKLDTWPGAGLAPTSAWEPGLLFADSYEIPTREEAATPAGLTLDVYFWRGDPLSGLPMRASDGRQISEVRLPVGRALPARPPRYDPQHEVGSHFEYDLELVGYDAKAGGDALYLTLYWRHRGNDPVPGDYTVMVHVTDSQGIPLVPPADSPPLGGDWPTSAWEPGYTVADTRLIALPPELPPGPYQLRIALYDLVGGERLLAADGDDVPWPDNVVVIDDLELQ